MSVIAVIITHAATAHATDSLITEEQQDGTLRPKDWKRPKVVRVEAFRGAMSYWGLATIQGWSTLRFLKNVAGQAAQFNIPQPFAHHVANNLELEFNNLQLPHNQQRGIGIHFTAYEHVKDDPATTKALALNAISLVSHVARGSLQRGDQTGRRADPWPWHYTDGRILLKKKGSQEHSGR